MLAYEGHLGVTLGSLWSRSGATWGAFWAHGGDFSSLWHHYGTIVESLWVKEVRFQKTLIFPTDFNDFIKLRGELWSTSGQHLAYECELWVTLASLLTCEIDFGASLGSLWGDFRIRG